eukprot:UN03195
MKKIKNSQRRKRQNNAKTTGGSPVISVSVFKVDESDIEIRPDLSMMEENKKIEEVLEKMMIDKNDDVQIPDESEKINDQIPDEREDKIDDQLVEGSENIKDDHMISEELVAKNIIRNLEILELWRSRMTWHHKKQISLDGSFDCEPGLSEILLTT